MTNRFSYCFSLGIANEMFLPQQCALCPIANAGVQNASVCMCGKLRANGVKSEGETNRRKRESNNKENGTFGKWRQARRQRVAYKISSGCTRTYSYASGQWKTPLVKKYGRKREVVKNQVPSSSYIGNCDGNVSPIFSRL